MDKFNSDDQYIYYCGQESHRGNGVALISKRVWNSVLGCTNIYKYYVLLVWSLDNHVVSYHSFGLVIFFILKSLFFSEMSNVTLTFFDIHLHGRTFSHPLIFRLYVSLGLKWISCRGHIYRSYFCIHSASLCLLVRAFNSFIFKLLIDM